MDVFITTLISVLLAASVNQTTVSDVLTLPETTITPFHSIAITPNPEPTNTPQEDQFIPIPFSSPNKKY